MGKMTKNTISSEKIFTLDKYMLDVTIMPRLKMAEHRIRKHGIYAERADRKRARFAVRNEFIREKSKI